MKSWRSESPASCTCSHTRVITSGTSAVSLQTNNSFILQKMILLLTVVLVTYFMVIITDKYFNELVPEYVPSRKDVLCCVAPCLLVQLSILPCKHSLFSNIS